MITREDVQPLSVAAGSAALLGLALGLWLSLPTLTTPVQAQTEIADQIDPNLARYRRVLEENGVSATPYILAVGYQPAPPAAAPRETVTAEDAMPDEGRISSDPTGSEDGHYARAELAALAATPPLQTDMPRYRPPAAVDDALFDTAASVTLPAQ